jgi:hypothetical protein
MGRPPSRPCWLPRAPACDLDARLGHARVVGGEPLDLPARWVDDVVVRRLLVLLALVAAILVASTTPASAKTPPFTVEVSDRAPEAGELVTVSVRMWDRLNPRQPDTSYRPPAGGLNGVLGLVAADDMEAGRPRPGSHQEPIELRYVRPGTFEGSFVAPEQGAVWVVPFPNVALNEVPDGTTELTVRGALPGRSPLVPVGAVAVAVAVAGAGGLLGAMRRRRRPGLAVNPA